MIGPAQHGVVRHAVRVARAAGIDVQHQLDLDDGAVGIRPAALHHWHFTDRLFGSSIEQATQRLLAAMDGVVGRHVVSLHDVPAATDDDRDIRRGDAYRRIAAAADAVVVASRHESSRLAGVGVEAAVDVIALPIVDNAGSPRCCRPVTARSVAVLGFVYPGKGHADVLDAVTDLPADVAVVVIGRASDGHEDLVDELQRTARRRGRRLDVTGYLSDAAVEQHLWSAGVPVVPARETSASASLGTWIGAGRRPLVARNGYTAELAGRDGALVTLYESDDLVTALRGALDRPATTWRSGPIPPDLGLAAVSRAHLALYARVLSS